MNYINIDQFEEFQDEVLRRLIKIDNDNEELLRRTAGKDSEDSDIVGLPNLPVASLDEFSNLNELLKDESLRRNLVGQFKDAYIKVV